MMKILVIAAHPDDEVLGCGGTLYKLSKIKDNQIYLAFAADGVSSRRDHSSKEIIQRKYAMRTVAEIIKAKIINKNSFPFRDQNLDKGDFMKIVGWIEKIISKYQPETIYTHWPNDLNRDHQIIAEATLVATRPQTCRIKGLYYYEVPETTNEGGILKNKEFMPNIYERVSLSKKRELMSKYQTELNRSDKWAKGIEALGHFRGFNSGYDFAEAFVLVRKLND